MLILDTNLLIRYFTNDNKELSPMAKTLLESGKELFVPDVVFVEIDYVLRNFYEVNKPEVIQALTFLTDSHLISSTKYMSKAVRLYEQSTNGLSDCIIIAISEGHFLASFDKKLLKAKGVKSYF